MNVLLLRVLRILMRHCEQPEGAQVFRVFLFASASIFRFPFNRNITLYCFLFPALNLFYEMFPLLCILLFNTGLLTGDIPC
jgi:hypothetical protein